MKSLALTTLLFAGCAGTLQVTGVTLVTVNAPVEASDVLETPIHPSISLRAGNLIPPEATTRAPELAQRMLEARAAYLETLDFAECIELLSPPELVRDALAQSDRTAAARVITLRCACRLARGDERGARREAQELALLGLPVPDLADSISPRAERLLADALAQSLERVTLSIESTPPGASVTLDGVEQSCSTPCRIDVPAGEHVLTLAADAHDDAVIVVHTDAPEVRTSMTPASAEQAAAQWHTRYSQTPDTWSSLRLLQVALRDRRVLLLSGNVAPEGWLLRAALAVDAQPPLLLERLIEPGDYEDGAREAVHDLLSTSGIIPPTPILEEPLFWLAVLGAAAIAGGITAGVLYEPEVRNPVRLRGEFP